MPFARPRCLARLVPLLALLLAPIPHAAAQPTPTPSAEAPDVLAVGTATLGEEDLAWQVIAATTSPDAGSVPGPVGFILADADALRIELPGDMPDADETRLAPGEARFAPAGERQVQPGERAPDETAYYEIALVAAAATPTADDPMLRSDPFPAPDGERELTLEQVDLAPRASATLPASDAPLALLVTAGAVEIGQAAATPVTLVTGEAGPAPGGISVRARGSTPATVVVALIGDDVDRGATGASGAATGASGTASGSTGSTTGGPVAPRPTAGPAPTPTPTAVPSPTPSPTAVPTAVPLDTDGDGLSDADEARRGTNPTSNDSDGDGIYDGFEVSIGYNPLSQDSDGNGVNDYDQYGAEEPVQGSGDADGDGLTDGYEGQVSLTNPNDADSDDDGLSDGAEVNYGSNPHTQDTDGDGLADGADVANGASPTARDTDGDGLGDGFEVNQGTSPASTDSDGDGVDDGYETGRGMNPRSADSDGDGLADGDELNVYGTNPLNPDSDGDEHGDGQEVNCGQDPNTYTDYTGVVAC